MSRNVLYTPFHPRWHRTRVSTWWWLESRSYFAFILRELSSIFVAWFVVYVLMLISAVGEGGAAYAEFLAWSREPLVLLVNVVALVFVALHAITWFNLAPQALAVRLGGRRVPGSLIAGSNYAALLAVSAIIIGLLVAEW